MTTVDDLGEFGLVQMSDDEVRDFLSNQGTGVLGLPAPDGPYLVPLSFGYDGDSRLFFTYVVGPESRKRSLSERTDTARFLVYDAPSAFVWESVLLTGTLEAATDDAVADHREAMNNAWRPGLFEQALSSADVEVYRFEIHEQSGVKHSGLPPEFTQSGEQAD